MKTEFGKIGNMIKKIFFFILMIIAGMTTAWAQTPQEPDKPAVTPTPSLSYGGKDLGLQAKPSSVVKDVSKRYKSDIDYFIDVVDWTRVSYDNFFVFLGGAGSAVGDGSVQGGFATKIADNHLGIYYNGNFFKTNGEDKDEESKWADNLAILFGSKDIGGIRFDLLFNKDTAFSKSENSGDKKSADGSFITSLQWGKKIGDFTPRATIGFQWPTYIVNENDNAAGDKKAEMWNDAILGVKLEAAYKDFSADYQLSANFGKTIKGSTTNKDYEYTANGSITNTLNLYYGFTGKFGDKLEIKLRPQVQFGLYFADHTYTEKYAGMDKEGSAANPEGQFLLSPIVEAGAKYALNEKWSIYTGLKVTPLKFTTQWTDSYENKENGTVTSQDSKSSKWQVDALSGATAAVGFELKPAQNLSVEFGLDKLITDAYANWSLNDGFKGKLAVVLRK